MADRTGTLDSVMLRRTPSDPLIRRSVPPPTGLLRLPGAGSWALGGGLPWGDGDHTGVCTGSRARTKLYYTVPSPTSSSTLRAETLLMFAAHSVALPAAALENLTSVWRHCRQSRLKLRARLSRRRCSTRVHFGNACAVQSVRAASTRRMRGKASTSDGSRHFRSESSAWQRQTAAP